LEQELAAYDLLYREEDDTADSERVTEHGPAWWNHKAASGRSQHHCPTLNYGIYYIYSTVILPKCHSIFETLNNLNCSGPSGKLGKQ
jgi:hypothetical protein